MKKVILASCIVFLLNISQSFGQHTCPAIASRSNGNGSANSCPGVSGTPVALNMTGQYAVVPSGAKTANIVWKHAATDAWATNPPAIVAVYSTSGGTSTAINTYPGPASIPSGTNVQNCFYTGASGNGNMPNAGIISFRFATTVNVADYAICTYDFGSNALVATPASVIAQPDPLDVTFVSFEIANYNNKIAVSWTVARAINVAEYVVERSFDGTNFEAVYTTADISSNTYSYVDDLQKNNYGETVFYRVKEIDVDGKTTLTSVQRAQLNPTENLAMWYAANKLIIQAPATGSATIQYISLSGQIIRQEQVSLNMGRNYIEVPESGTMELVRVIAFGNSFVCKIPLH